VSLFRRRPRVAATLPAGFHAGEARALQTTVLEALTVVERAHGVPVPVEVEIEAGRGARLVVVARNLVLGFVPDAHTAALAAQRAAGGRARLVVPGLLVPADGLWRVWVGPVPEGGVPAVPAEADVLAAPEATVLGIPLRRGEAD
jgi:hypothetical protein